MWWFGLNAFWSRCLVSAYVITRSIVRMSAFLDLAHILVQQRTRDGSVATAVAGEARLRPDTNFKIEIVLVIARHLSAQFGAFGVVLVVGRVGGIR